MDSIRDTAKDIVDKLVPVDDVDDDGDADLFVKAVHMLKDALDKWKAENPGQHCDIHAVRKDNDEIEIVITPR